MKKILNINVLSFLTLLILIFISLNIGNYKIDYSKLIDTSSLDYSIFVLRAIRISAAILVGIALSLSGAIFQALFKNTLASPYTLGLSSGAGFGASVAILLGLSSFFISFISIIFALISVLASLFLAKNNYNSLILAGVLVSAFFQSLIALLKFLADPFEKLPQIVFWLLGTLSGVNLEKIIYILPFYLISLFILLLYKNRLNVLSLDDTLAASFGVNARFDRIILIVFCAILCAISVSLSGIIAWVGVILPQVARMLVGSNFNKLMPLSISFGAIYLIIIDNFARSLSASEIPLGVLSSIIALPLIFVLFYKKDFYARN